MGRHKIQLVSHPQTPPTTVKGIEVEWNPSDESWLGEEDGNRLIKFVVKGAADLLLPEAHAPERADGLWKTTCFELFIRNGPGGGYLEFNFSPSGQWAAYAFDSYRNGMRDYPFPAPNITGALEGNRYVLRANVDASINLPANGTYNLSAVIEERGGRKSYWAVAHPPGPPDFHNEACFIA